MPVDTQTAALLAKLKLHDAAPGQDITIAQMRAGANALFLGFAGQSEPACVVEDRTIPGPAGPVPLRIYWPEHKSRAPLPIIVFFHGGGWSLGDVASYDSFVRSLCALGPAIMISVDYRLAPEHKYPAGLEDCAAAANWALAHAEELGGAPGNVAVMGDSAGGNLATVIAHRIGAAGRRRLAAQFLLYPVLDVSRPHAHYPSRMAFGDGDYLLSRAGIDAATDWYLDDPACTVQPDISPLRETDLSLLPPTVLMVGGYDPLLDETRAYHRRLEAAGVETRFTCFKSTIHAFLSFGVLDVAQAGRRALADTIRDLMPPS